MLESDTPSKTFLGVRFTLYGFNPVDEHKVRAKLIDGGGVGVGQYSQNCTHLIVDNIVYDDPVCVAARNDGKTVVTGLWVDHSFDIGMPVDATSVMYRPPRDLNGIPGAESLIICLTGYQRQDRDDIMTMVSLMGAQFSKPLVANKVTHLICYKFEGEKYELAKKMKRIKLINHRWLEDCLREWELLSEANYSKSGYELEMMEAEAKDSEEEDEETTSKQYGQRCLNRSPHNLKAGTLCSTELPNSAAKVPASTVMRHSPNTKEVLLTPGKCHEGTSLSNVNAPQLHAFQDALIVRNATSSKLSEPDNRSPNCTKLDNNWVSTSRSPSLSDEKFTAISYARKTPRKSPDKSALPALSREVSGNISGPPRDMTFKDASDISSSKMQQPEGRISSCFIESPQKRSGLPHGEDSAGIVPQKRGLELSASSSKSQKMSHNAKAGGNGSALNTERLKSTSLEGDQLDIKDCSVSKTGYMDVEPDGCASNATTKSLSNVLPSLKTVTAGNRENNTDERSPKTSLRGYRESTLASKQDMQNENGDVKSPQKSFTGLRELSSACIPNVGESGMGSCGLVVGVPGELQNKQQDIEVPALDERKLEHSENPATLDLLEGGNDKTVKKPPNKKMLGKKTLGSRGKLSNIANRKGSIYLSKTASENDSTICSSGAKEHAIPKSPSEFETSPSAIRMEATEHAIPKSPCEFETSPSTIGMEATKNVIEKVVTESQAAAAASKTAFMDDETEAPDGEDVNGYEKMPGEEKADLVESARKAERMDEIEHVRPDSNVGVHGSLVTLDKETKAIDSERMAVGSRNSELGESTLESVGLKRNATKRKKELPGKAKKKAVPSEPKSNLVAEDTSAAKNLEEKDDEKENSEPHDVAKTNSCNGSSKMENSMKADKSSPIERKELAGKSVIKPNTKAVKASNKSRKVDSNATERKKELPGKAKKKTVPFEPKSNLVTADTSAAKNVEEKDDDKENSEPHDVAKTNSCNESSKMENSVKADKSSPVDQKEIAGKSVIKPNKKAVKTSKKSQKVDSNAQPVEKVFNMLKTEPVWFIVSGHRLQRKEFQQAIRRLKGKVCRDSHQWSYQATHFIAPDIRRTEKFFAAAASGRWILKTDYLSACSQAGQFLPEEAYEWHMSGLSEDGAINLEAPRKWRHLRERTGHGAFYGMRIIVYGECIAPPLDTLKRVVKAGDGTILATSPPYTKFLNSGVDYAVVSPGMPRVDVWVQEFLRHEIPCVVADYLVEYVCKPGYSLERHVLYNTHEWAEKSFANLTSRAEEIVEDLTTTITTSTPPDDCGSNDVSCQVCGSSERGKVMLICGDESGSVGCGVGTHIDCCDPPLEEVPLDDWFCPKCSTNRKSATPPKKRKKATSQSKGK